MGRDLFTSYSYSSATRSRGIDSSSSHVTRHAEEQVRKTGKLDPAVDPAVDPIRRSLIRFDAREDGKWVVTVGCPMNLEGSCDTTGSMGDNVDKAMKALPKTHELVSEMLPGYDLQLALGIFGDREDKFIINRPQFEMTAEKIVDYLTKMNPERGGWGNGGEDPQYAAFAAAYLTDAYTNRIGLKGYHFITTDEPCHTRISKQQLERVFGEGVWEALASNNHPEITKNEIPDVQDVFIELHKKFHAFVIIITDEWDSDSVKRDWQRYYDAAHTVYLMTTEDLPAVQAALVGLTEGTLQPIDVKDYLEKHDVCHAGRVAEQLTAVEFAAQRKLAEKSKMVIPKAGDVFVKKTDAQPDTSASSEDASDVKADDTEWL